MSLYGRFTATALALGAGAVLLSAPAGCAFEDKAERQKGEVDDSLPPDDPGEPIALGKADAGDQVVDISVESPHPYTNNLDQEFDVDLESVLPWCAFRARLHFNAARVESGYDFLHISGNGGSDVQTWTGNHDGEWSDWFAIDQSDKQMTVRLESDYSITDHGFEVDQVAYQGSPICPAVVYPPCPSGTVNVNPPPGVCECQQQPTCIATADVEIQHNLFRGFQNSGNLVRGHDAFALSTGPADGLVETNIGTVDEDGLLALVRDMALAGVLERAGYDRPASEWNEYFALRIGHDIDVVFRAPQGEHDPEIEGFIARFEALFDCNDGDQPLTCGTDYSCSADGQCVENCACTALWAPVCGIDGRTYSNDGCAACANIPIAHPGECGIEGDLCGGLGGFTCQPDFKCRFGPGVYEYPFPDAAGTCVPADYCDTAADCDGLIHPAVPGQWACNANQCSWEQNVPWQAVPSWSFETDHPYSNDANVWKQLYLPAGAIEMRLVMVGVFELEQGYDYLEVWSWIDGSWQRVKRYTGSVGPSAGETFEGRYHYLHFVSDYSVTKEGFGLLAEYR